MITTEPLLVAADAESLYGKVMAYIAQTKKQVNDGLSVSDLVEIIVSGMRLTIGAVDELHLAGSMKKQIVADCAAQLFTEFSDLVIPLPVRPIWWLVKPALRKFVHTAAAGAVEALLPIVRNADL